MPKLFIRDLALENLKIRIDFFDRIPSNTNMTIAFEIAEAVVLNEFKHGRIAADDKRIAKYEKIKNLALDNKSFNERILAFKKSMQQFEKLVGITIPIGKPTDLSKFK
jgi:hypothetical protein